MIYDIEYRYWICLPVLLFIIQEKVFLNRLENLEKFNPNV